MADGSILIEPVDGLPEVHEGDDIAALIAASLNGPARDGAVVVVSHKIVSKSEGAVVSLSDVVPGEQASRIASEQGRDPRHVQVILDQSSEVLRAEHGVLVCVTHHGFVCANAGVDLSNAGRAETAVVLPRDPDRSARDLRAGLHRLTGTSPAVVIADSFGRAWRLGQLDTAIGCAGLAPLESWDGRSDRDGRPLQATLPAVADAVAAAADLARSKDSGRPVVVVHGLSRFVTDDDGPGAAALLRPAGQDLFRS